MARFCSFLFQQQQQQQQPDLKYLSQPIPAYDPISTPESNEVRRRRRRLGLVDKEELEEEERQRIL